MNIWDLLIFFLIFCFIMRNHLRDSPQFLHESLWQVDSSISAIIISIDEFALELGDEENFSNFILSFVISANKRADGIAQYLMEGIV